MALFEQLGFAGRHDQVHDYAMVHRGGIELHFTFAPELDPWTSSGMAFIRLDDVTTLCEEFKATGALPVVAAPRSELRHSERVRGEVRRKWEAGESIARMGEIADQPWGIREILR